MLVVSVTSRASVMATNMDRFTWGHPDVVARMGLGAMAIQVDADADPETARSLKVPLAPVTIAFRDGAEIDRFSGFLQEVKVIEWLEGLVRGETLLQRHRADVAAAPNDVGARMDLGATLMNAELFEEATTEHVWLWKHMVAHAPGIEGIKHQFVTNRVKDIVAAHPPAREVFGALRDASTPDLDAPSPAAFADWCSLNNALGEPERTIAWFDAHHARAMTTPELASAIVTSLEPHLIARERWADLGRLYKEPVTEFREAATLRADVHAELALMATMQPAGNTGPLALPAGHAEFLEVTRNGTNESLRQLARKLVRALHASGREGEAKQIADMAIAADDSAEMATALVRRGGATARHSGAGTA